MTDSPKQRSQTYSVEVCCNNCTSSNENKNNGKFASFQSQRYVQRPKKFLWITPPSISRSVLWMAKPASITVRGPVGKKQWPSYE